MLRNQRPSAKQALLRLLLLLLVLLSLLPAAPPCVLKRPTHHSQHTHTTYLRRAHPHGPHLPPLLLAWWLLIKQRGVSHSKPITGAYSISEIKRVLFSCGAVRCRTVFCGVVRWFTVSYGVVRCLVRVSVRVSYGVRTESTPYATYGAPPSENAAAFSTRSKPPALCNIDQRSFIKARQTDGRTH